MKLIIMQFSAVSSFPLQAKCPSWHPSFEHRHSIFSSLMRDQASHPFKTTGRIIVLNVSLIEHGKTTDSG